jgi:hypothetical protein
MMFSLLLAQAAASSPVLDFDLAKLAPTKPSCNAGAAPPGGEIVVCARKNVETDIPVKDRPAELLLPKAEFKLFGQVRGKVAGQQGNVGPIPTNRAMVTMSVPF